MLYSLGKSLVTKKLFKAWREKTDEEAFKEEEDNDEDHGDEDDDELSVVPEKTKGMYRNRFLDFNRKKRRIDDVDDDIEDIYSSPFSSNFSSASASSSASSSSSYALPNTTTSPTQPCYTDDAIGGVVSP